MYFRDTVVSLKEVRFNESNEKLLFLFEGGILTDCNEQIIDDSDYNENTCSGENEERTIKLDNLPSENNSSTIPKNLLWLLSTADLRHQCSHMRSLIQNQNIEQQRQR